MSEVTKTPMTEIEVTVDNHTHKGELCKKGDKIKVPAATAEMLKKAWAAQKKEADK